MISYVKYIDGLRGVAILLVMSLHYGLTDFGWIGVQLFFVLSGYLITGILLKQKAKGGSIFSNLKRFWIRRSLRIFPLYFGYLSFFLLTYLVWSFPHYFGNFAPYLFSYTFNFTRTASWWLVTPFFTHLWSLSIEEQFYIFFPFLIFLCSLRQIRFVLIAIILCGPFLRLFLGDVVYSGVTSLEDRADAIYWNTFTHIDAFCYGGMLHFLKAFAGKYEYSKRILFAFLVMLIAGSISYSMYGSEHAYFRDFGYALGKIGHYEFVWHYTVLNVLFAVLLNGLEKGSNERLLVFTRKLLEGRILVLIGKVSYGMYIFHWAIYSFGFYPVAREWSYGLKVAAFLPYFLTVYLFAFLSYYFFEKRFLLLKSRFE